MAVEMMGKGVMSRKTQMIFLVTMSMDDGCRDDEKRGGIKFNTRDFHGMGVTLAFFILSTVFIERELTIN